MSNTDLAALAAELKAKGVRALTVAWCDANGIQRSRSAPIDKLQSAVDRGMGCSFLFAVFDTRDNNPPDLNRSGIWIKTRGNRLKRLSMYNKNIIWLLFPLLLPCADQA